MLDQLNKEKVYACIAELLSPSQSFNPMLPLREMGYNSVDLAELKISLQKAFKIQLSSSFFFEYSTPKAIADYLTAGFEKIELPYSSIELSVSPTRDPIAIVGMACRFPGGIKNTEDYWRILKEGIDTITEVPESRWKKKDYAEFPIHWGGFVEDVDKFDAGFFNISPHEAELMDPQHRLLLETSWEALEYAGISPDNLRGGKGSVYVGIFTHDYEQLLNKNQSPSDIDAHYGTGNSASVAAGRIAYVLGLQGPAMTVNTACSSSLVALHLASQSLREGESKIALACGVNLVLSPELSISFAKAGMLSKDGHCKTFDTLANGYVRSEGCAVVVLKRLSQALADGNKVLAVLRNSIINQDGASNGLTAPNKSAQVDLLQSVFKDTDLSPERISYIETHGTGTALGDPIEVSAIGTVYSHREIPLILGSVKTNIGHTEAVAGLAGLLKVVLALNHKKIPANLHFTSLNSQISLKEFKGQIPSQNISWPEEKGKTRVAAVSSFGFSGTNAHVIIEEGPEYILSDEQHKPYYLVCISAKHPDSLKQRIEDLSAYLAKNPTLPIEAVAYTLNATRSHFNHRLAVVVSSTTELQQKLEQIHNHQKIKDCFKGQVTEEPDDSAIYRKVLHTSMEELKTINFTNSQHYKDNLEALANFYVKGYKFDWTLLHQNESNQTVALPTYPFLKERYWFPETKDLTSKIEESGVYFYAPTWITKEIEKVETPKSLLIFENGSLGKHLQDSINVIKIKFAESYRVTEEGYEINKNEPNDYKTLFNTLKIANTFPTTIIYRTIFNPETLCQELLYLSQALIEQKETFEILFVSEGEKRVLLTSAISAFTKVLQKESSSIHCRIIELEEISAEYMLQEFGQKEREVRYNLGQREVKICNQTNARSHDFILKEKSTYLITGGASGIGLIFARYLAKHYQARLILTGRSELSDAKKAELDTLGTELYYIQSDISDRKDVERLFQEIRLKFGFINGIIHSAGISKNAFIVKKDFKDIAEVLAPKVIGTIYLDDLTKDDPLDFLILFSSIASVIPDPGQCDYAYANGFMDGFAYYRESLRQRGLRKGKTIAINWPYWADGGMQLDSGSIQLLEQNLGIVPLSQKEGIEAFLTSLRFDAPQLIVLSGKKDKLNETLNHVAFIKNQKSESISLNHEDMISEVAFLLKKMVSKLLKIKIENVKLGVNLSEYGMDSILFNALTVQINDHYKLNLTPVIFYNYSNIKDLSVYLAAEFPKNVEKCHQNDEEVAKKITLTSPESQRFKEIRCDVKNQEKDYFPIAIIGMDGVFPKSNNLETFWKHLQSGDDLITEIPIERWDWREYYGDSTTNPTKTNSKWGGFIENVDKFDASFFNISPREAQLMDPQHRLFLETVWKTFENGGYDPYNLPTQNIAIFVGVQFNEYQELIARLNEPDAYIATGNSHAMLANRVSYLLNLHGPSEAVDTACSSSLVAIHRAISSLQRNECSLAIAGGVSLALSPETYVNTSQMGILSSDGHCKTFDKSANGYVKGEGVGAILLKPLAQAKIDGDIIHGIIIGSAVNHGGKSQSLTAPNVNAQTQLLETSYSIANIKPSSISYIEAHGTGTVLGDPIEIEGLKKAFVNVPGENTCGIGSVKSNIGHLEPAAGIAGVIKVLLSMRYAKLPGNLHFNEINPYINLKNSPFYIVDKTKEWQKLSDEQDKPIPRRAGISSFGFGGVNAHVVIEEGPEYILSDEQHKPYYLVCISAKHPDSLKQRIEDLSVYLAENPTLPIEAIAYTLNATRSHFNHRLAVVVSSTTELQQKLEQIHNNQEVKDYFKGQVVQEPDADQIYKQVLESSLEKLKILNIQEANKYKELLKTLANLYAKGYEFEWYLLHQHENQKAISLPTYPFLKTRYWIDTHQKKTAVVKDLKLTATPSSIKLKLTDSHKNNMEHSNVKDILNISKIKETLKEILKNLLYLEVLDESKAFKELGVDSILGVEFIRKINTFFNTNLAAAKIYDFPDIDTLTGYLMKILPEQNTYKNPESEVSLNKIKLDDFLASTDIVFDSLAESKVLKTKNEKDDIAIIGMAAYLPEAKNVEALWENLKKSKLSVKEIPPERWSVAQYYSDNHSEAGKSYSKWGGFIEGVEEFDPLFFGISPSEAKWIDPQQRLFLETGWKALEDSGYINSLNGSRCGVYVGVLGNDYQELIQRIDRKKIPPGFALLGNSESILSARIAYFLNLKGPSITVDTACSSSLVALHLGCQSLRNQETDLMLVGGVTLYLTEGPYIEMCQSQMLSKDGLCKVFDNNADGFVPGEGSAALVLKRLEDAKNAGDRIYGIIRGSGINQDGKTNGITAPSSESQKSLITSIYKQNGINPEEISYLEAHGTGTKLGDPIEVSALTEAFTEFTNKKQYCGLGSLKSNLGHTSAAAGVASIIKVLLCLQHKQLVPSLNFNSPNEHINFVNSPFYVNTELKAWERINNRPLLSAISSFGFSGTNAHVVIEEGPEYNLSTEQHKPYYLVCVSAKHPDSLKQRVEDLSVYLAKNSTIPIEAVAYTLNARRSHFKYRLALVVSSTEDLQNKLNQIKKNQKLKDCFEGECNKTEKRIRDGDNNILEKLSNELEIHEYKKNLLLLANLYTEGYVIDWNLLHKNESNQKINLPTYPFLKKRYWVPVNQPEHEEVESICN